MTPTPRFSREAVAALFIERQWLDRPRGRVLSAATLGEFAERTGGLQIDSINVLDRAHYLTAWSRFDAYVRAELDRLIYGERVLFEYWSHAACFVPRAHAAQWRRAMVDYRRQHVGWSGWLRKNGKVITRVEQAIRERGPLGNADFREKKPGGAGWWSWKPSTHAFHYLWMSGRLLVHERVHFQKRFDLAERVLPDLGAQEPLPWPEFLAWHMRQSLRSMGAATEADLRMYLSYPRVPAPKRRAVLATLLKSGEVVPVEVEGDGGKWYALAEDLPALDAAANRRDPARGTTLLSPFDSFLWHRERVKALLGFDYRIEVYTPGHKRVHGYYTLPLYHDGQLVGRVDAKNHRAERRLEVRHVHFEPWILKGGKPPAASWGPLDRGAVLAGLADSVASLARFQGAEAVSFGRVSPAALKPDVLAAAASGIAPARASRSVATDAPSTKPVIDKLGVKPGMRVAVLGVTDAGFDRDLAARTTDIARARPRRETDLVFLAATDRARLERLAALMDAIRPEGGIWVVWPKGRPEFREDDIREVALRVGLVDVKIVAFSQTHSALKLVIPVARRGPRPKARARG